MLLLLSRRDVVKLQSRLYDFVLKFQVSRRACYSFLGRPNLVICRWNFSNPCKDFGARAKTIFSQLPIDILSGWTSYESVWGCLQNLPPHNCRLFILSRVFQRWRLKTTGQVSLVQFSCTKKLWDEAGGQPLLPCLSRRLCYLISKSISCMIDLKIKQIRKKSICLFLGLVPKKKNSRSQL